MPQDENEKGPDMDMIIKQFQIYFETGYVKMSTVKALEEKRETLKMATSLEMNIRRFKNQNATNSLVQKSSDLNNTSFVIGRPRAGPSSSGASQPIISVDEPESSTGQGSNMSLSQRVDMETWELQNQVNHILDNSYCS